MGATLQDPAKLLEDGEPASALETPGTRGEEAGRGSDRKPLLAGVLTVFSKRPEGAHEELRPDGSLRRTLSYPDPFYTQVRPRSSNAGPAHVCGST